MSSRDWTAELDELRTAEQTNPSAEPKALDACERCGDPESITTAGDHVADYGAPLCGTCGALWLRTVMRSWDASLAKFTGNASEDAQRDYLRLVAERERSEALHAQRKAERKAVVEARRIERRNDAERMAEDNARAVLAIVTERPRPTLEIASELGVSGRTAGRYVALAKRKGYVRADGWDVHPVREAQQPEAA